MDTNGHEVGEMEVVVQKKAYSTEEIQEMMITIGARDVSVKQVEAAIKCHEWLTTAGAKALAVTKILNDLSVWERAVARDDKPMLGEHYESTRKISEKDMASYKSFRLEVSKYFLSAHKALVDLCDGGKNVGTKKGLKASTIDRVTSFNPLAGRIARD